MIPVNGHKNLYRDENTGAIINCDSFEYSQYISNREKRKKEKELYRIEIDNLKNEVSEIKSLLKELINGLKWHKTIINE